MEANAKILEMVEAGKAAIKLREEAEAAEKWFQQTFFMARWAELLEDVRRLFPSDIAQYVSLPDYELEHPECFGSRRTMFSLRLRIDGFAPIAFYVERYDGQWLQCGEPLKHDKKGALYQVPLAEWDSCFGMSYNWPDAVVSTDDLSLALVAAEEQGRRYSKMEEEYMPKASEAIYEPMEDECANPLMDELVKLIRDVVWKELAG